jgi:peptidoglycan/LPS O-acetylase OafA/YrhL
MSSVSTSSLTASSVSSECKKKVEKAEASIGYRADIDGLRGLSILFVFLYHLFPGFFAGGFLGVDVFFVISGFLISKILFTKLESGTFSFIDFYSRRIKRIFPALIITSVLCLSYGWLVLFPDEFRSLTKHICSSSVFLTNLSLYKEIGYFDVAAEAKPFLHLWSLSIEEQFYAFWPFFLWILLRITKNTFFKTARHSFMIFCLSSFSLFSFLGYLYLYKISQSFSFYFTGARIWEMSLGSLGAYYCLFLRKKEGSLLVKNWISVGCLVTVLISLFFLRKTHEYFQILTVIPVLSSLFLLLNQETVSVNKKILAQPLLVFFGLISYPLYLLHWSCISFLKIILGYTLCWTTMISVCVLVTLAAYLLYKYVESPVRKSRSGALVWGLIAAMGILGGIGYSGYRSFLKPRISYILPHSEKVTEAINDWEYPTSKMQPFTVNGDIFYRLGTAQPVVFFLGDSNAEQYAVRFQKLMDEGHAKKSMVFATRGGVPPLPHVARTDKEREFVENAMQYALKEEVKEIVITALWGSYLHYEATHQIYKSGLIQGTLAEPRLLKKAVSDLIQFIRDLTSRGKKVYIISSIPHGAGFDPKNFFKRNLLGQFQMSIKHASKKEWLSYNQKARLILDEIAKNTKAVFLNPEDFLCHQDLCYTHGPDGQAFYKDSSHLSRQYVREHVTFLDFLLKN